RSDFAKILKRLIESLEEHGVDLAFRRRRLAVREHANNQPGPRNVSVSCAVADRRPLVTPKQAQSRFGRLKNAQSKSWMVQCRLGNRLTIYDGNDALQFALLLRCQHVAFEKRPDPIC